MTPAAALVVCTSPAGDVATHPGVRRTHAILHAHGVRADLVGRPASDMSEVLRATGRVLGSAVDGVDAASYAVWVAWLSNREDLAILEEIATLAGIPAAAGERTHAAQPRIVAIGPAAVYRERVERIADASLAGDAECWLPEFAHVLRDGADQARAHVNAWRIAPRSARLAARRVAFPESIPVQATHTDADALPLALASGCAFARADCGAPGAHACPPRRLAREAIARVVVDAVRATGWGRVRIDARGWDPSDDLHDIAAEVNGTLAGLRVRVEWEREAIRGADGEPLPEMHGVEIVDVADVPAPGVPGDAPSTTAFGRAKRRRPALATGRTTTRIRVHFTRGEEMRFASHLDMMRTIERTLRRSGLAVAQTQGRTPRPKIAYGPPLACGWTSDAEYVDVDVRDAPQGDLARLLDRACPPGLGVRAVVPVPGSVPSLASAIDGAAYRVVLPFADWRDVCTAAPAVTDPVALAALWNERASAFLRSSEWTVRRRAHDEPVNVRPSVSSLTWTETDAALTVRLTHPAAVRPEMLVAHLLAPAGALDPRCVRVAREALWITRPDGLVTPMGAATPSRLGVRFARVDATRRDECFVRSS